MKKKALKAGVASVLALGAGVAAINARKNYKAEKVQVKKHQEEELANFRNTERGTNEKNSKGIYYSNGNYEAFARPEKPEGSGLFPGKRCADARQEHPYPGSNGHRRRCL